MLPAPLEQQSAPPLLNADELFVAQTQAGRERLLRFYEAGLYAYRRDRERWEQTLQAVLVDEPDNPYYRWVSNAK